MTTPPRPRIVSKLEILTLRKRAAAEALAKAERLWLAELFAELDAGEEKVSLAKRAGISRSRLYQIVGTPRPDPRP
jgi:hypothetical protein